MRLTTFNPSIIVKEAEPVACLVSPSGFIINLCGHIK